MLYYHVAFFMLFIIYNQNIHQLNSVRCAKNCWFGPVAPGSQHPFPEPCNTIDIDPITTECTATIAIKLSDNSLLGVLDTKPRTSNMSAKMEIFLEFNRHSTISMINYTCTTADHCDRDFVLESIGTSKWTQLNETKTRAKITSLLIDPTFSKKNFTCAHNITCEAPYDNCQADLMIKTFTSKSNITEFSNNYKCIINHLTAIGIFYYFNAPSNEYNTVTEVMCNKNDCNQREIVEQAYNIIQNEYMHPLNYSQFIPKINRL
ncbi:unnamed protein product [Adineta steineri]|uniref:Uncharacterized protein n=1 Tax=Adineta steineri TaxID=433720 RepID=A0A819ZED8_9BILA|nr:unnamed protein product [Adineta steineri]CAF4167368.1 unnamed protein product [Adineta steineri]